MYACYDSADDALIGDFPQVQHFPPRSRNRDFPERPEECQWDTDLSGVELAEGTKLTTFLSTVNMSGVLAAAPAYEMLVGLGSGELPGGDAGPWCVPVPNAKRRARPRGERDGATVHEPGPGRSVRLR